MLDLKMPMRLSVGIILVFLLGINPSSYSQNREKESNFFVDNLIEQWFKRQIDSAYIESYTNELSLRLTGVSKFNSFRIKDREADAWVRYQPESKLSAGVGITYKWFSVDITFKVGIPGEDVESSKAFDFQGRVFGLKQYAGLIYKYYFGYDVNKIHNLINQVPDSLIQREDIRSSYVSLEYMYAFNYGKFSFKAPFFYNEIQKKSAGSFIGGASFVSYALDGDQPILPEEVWTEFNPKLTFNSLYLASLSLQFGYMYTLVVGNNFYLTLGLIPGIALSGGDYQVENRESMGLFPSANIRTMNSMGYNARRIYVGLQFEGDIFSARIDKKANVGIDHAKGRIFIGYRFKRK
jgi:hypothetical protein